jgi:hypothetical protein
MWEIDFARHKRAKLIGATIMLGLSMAAPTLTQGTSGSRRIVKVTRWDRDGFELNVLERSLQKELGDEAVLEGGDFSKEQCPQGVPCDIVSINRETDSDYSIVVRDGGQESPHRKLFLSWPCPAGYSEAECKHSVQVTPIGALVDHLKRCHEKHELTKCDNL